MILNEGGNIFKNPDGQSATQRINKQDVDPTLAWLEKIVGVDLINNKLGTTGIKSTSGDLDVAIDAEKNQKPDIEKKLVAFVQQNYPQDDPKQWVRKSGISVHFKTPINGNQANGFVQTDLMFGDPEYMKFGLKGIGDEKSPYKGAHRLIMIASVAKGLGYKFSNVNGLSNRETGDFITKDPNEIAKQLLGKSASAKDLDSVESIHAIIKKMPNYEELVADAKDNFEKQGLRLPESIENQTGSREWYREVMELLK